ncbi:MAG: hypothetical protein ACE5OZ_07390 [Candidatus Heimdallarchaeota archaeon]
MSEEDKIGEAINKNWLEYLKDADKDEDRAFPGLVALEDEDDSESLYLYVLVDKKHHTITNIEGPMYSEFWQGHSSLKSWLATIAVDHTTTVGEIREVDLADECNYREDPLDEDDYEACDWE